MLDSSLGDLLVPPLPAKLIVFCEHNCYLGLNLSSGLGFRSSCSPRPEMVRYRRCWREVQADQVDGKLGSLRKFGINGQAFVEKLEALDDADHTMCALCSESKPAKANLNAFRMYESKAASATWRLFGLHWLLLHCLCNVSMAKHGVFKSELRGDTVQPLSMTP